jgi:hypothetical protein
VNLYHSTGEYLTVHQADSGTDHAAKTPTTRSEVQPAA